MNYHLLIKEIIQGMGDNWPVSGSQGEDVAYTLNVSETTTTILLYVQISLIMIQN